MWHVSRLFVTAQSPCFACLLFLHTFGCRLRSARMVGAGHRMCQSARHTGSAGYEPLARDRVPLVLYASSSWATPGNACMSTSCGGSGGTRARHWALGRTTERSARAFRRKEIEFPLLGPHKVQISIELRRFFIGPTGVFVTRACGIRPMA